MLLYGQPGTGKTEFSLALIKLWESLGRVKVKSIKGPELASKYFGETEK